MDNSKKDFEDAFVVQDTADVMTEIKKKDKKEKKKQTRDVVLELCFYLFLLVLCAYIIPTFFLQRTIVDGPSMEPALKDGESLLIEKISVWSGNLERFDVIVFYPNGKDDKEYYVKRIIGLPGETVQIEDGRILINGEILEEDYGYEEEISYPGLAAGEIVLGEEEYFVLGDNREVSFDSRYTKVGNVKKENISGKVILRIWPLSEFGTVR